MRNVPRGEEPKSAREGKRIQIFLGERGGEGM